MSKISHKQILKNINAVYVKKNIGPKNHLNNTVIENIRA